jgi:hypothetical protein
MKKLANISLFVLLLASLGAAQISDSPDLPREGIIPELGPSDILIPREDLGNKSEPLPPNGLPMDALNADGYVGPDDVKNQVNPIGGSALDSLEQNPSEAVNPLYGIAPYEPPQWEPKDQLSPDRGNSGIDDVKNQLNPTGGSALDSLEQNPSEAVNPLYGIAPYEPPQWEPKDQLNPDRGDSGIDDVKDQLNPDRGDSGIDDVKDQLNPDRGDSGIDDVKDQLNPDRGDDSFEPKDRLNP